MTTGQFSQAQRESLINLLTLGMYADGHLSLKEDEALENMVEGFGWESGTSLGIFIESAITRANRADTDEKVDAYITKCAAAFETEGAKRFAMDCLIRFLQVDGVAKTEAPFLKKLHGVFGV